MIVLNLILYYLVIIPISLLPFPVLYFFSDFLYVVLYKIAGYRQKVVLQNLRNSFPEKSPAEIKKIAALFYHHLCDVIVESFKSFTISQEEILKRMVLLNPDLLNSYYDKGQSVILSGGHYNNWEWIATSIDQQIKHQSIAIYKQLANKFFDKKMRDTRGRFGLIMVATKIVKETFEANKNALTATIFGSDQSPGKVATSYWMKFLNQDTAVLYGTEKYAKEYNFPVLFGTITKVKRGYYTFNFLVVENDPVSSPFGAITEKSTRMLEEEIIKAPQYWLWTHRRWKHKKEAKELV
ncbi:MAG: lysophospholipid acyltransferase family protein [Bacteroidota bacterium]|nr:lysophospholipid acyltransferase family protein [Bacteroidota bacterium]